jgi:hypothetical protein
MYTLNVAICGTVPLLQHRFAPPELDRLMQGATRKSGAPDHSLEWLETMYVTDGGFLYQPASHIESAMVKAAGTFKIKGARGKTWKDPVRAYCYVKPERVLHLYQGQPVQAPGAELLHAPTEHLSVSVMRVVVQRAGAGAPGAVASGSRLWADKPPLDVRNRALIAVLLMSGVRRSEAAVLRWSL